MLSNKYHSCQFFHSNKNTHNYFVFYRRGEFVTLKNSKTLTKDDYEADVNVLIKDSTALETDKFGECASGSGHGFNIPSTQG